MKQLFCWFLPLTVLVLLAFSYPPDVLSQEPNRAGTFRGNDNKSEMDSRLKHAGMTCHVHHVIPAKAGIHPVGNSFSEEPSRTCGLPPRVKMRPKGFLKPFGSGQTLFARELESPLQSWSAGEPKILTATASITTPYFIDVSRQTGIEATQRAIWDAKTSGTGYLAIGQAWGDYNNDGWIDLYVTGNLDPNTLYLNNRDGTFSISPLSGQVSLPNRVSGGVVWADYDNDGWRDLYVLNQGANVLFRNHQGRYFSDVTPTAGVGDTGKGETATWGDYDNDGFLDLYVVNWSCLPECNPLDFSLHQDRLYHNNGDGTFSDVSASLDYEKLLGAGFSASFMDYDNDGDADLYVVNDEFKNPIGNVLWRNEGPGCTSWCWSDMSAQAGADTVTSAMGLAVGDYDNDSDLDFYFSNMINRMTLLQNQGNGTFVDVAKAAGVSVGATPAVAWGTAFFDYDNDGWLDLSLVTTKFIQQEIYMEPEGMHFAYPNFLFHNDGDGTFSDVSDKAWLDNMAATKGFAYADYDNDGRLDFVTGNWNEGYTLYRNKGLAGTENHWLTIRLFGRGPVNRDGIGARVYLTRNDGLTLMQEVKSGSSLGAGNDIALHFGLGPVTTAEEVTVVWPDGLRHTYKALTGDRIWHLAYPAYAWPQPTSEKP